MATNNNPILYITAKFKPDLKEDLNKQLAGIKLDPIKVRAEFSEKDIIKDLTALQKRLQQINNELEKTSKKAGGGDAPSLRNIDNQYKKLIDSIETVQRKSANIIDTRKTEDLKNALNALADAQKRLNEAKNAYNADPTKANLNNYQAIATDVQLAVKHVREFTTENNKLIKAEDAVAKKAEALVLKQESMNTAFEKSRDSINAFIDGMSRGEQKRFADEIQQIVNALDNFGGTKEELSDINNMFGQLARSVYDSRNQIDGLTKMADVLWKRVSSFISFAAIANGIIKTYQEAYQFTKELDEAMISLKKVTDETNYAYSKFLDNAITKGKELGKSITDIVQITANWAKLGYDLADASVLAETSIIYANVGEISNVDDAVQDITSALKAFDITAEDSIAVVDKLNEISNNYAVTAADLGTAIRNSGSSLSVAGNTIDEALAMITGITEITGNASEAGNALRTISMRIRGAKIELQQAGEDVEGMASSTAKLRDKIMGIAGIDILDTNNQLKSTYDILNEIANKWGVISQNSLNASALLEELAGKNRANALASLLKNWSQVQKAVESAENSQGSALKEQQAYMEGIEYRLDSIRAIWQDIYTNLINSDDFKSLLDFVKGALERIAWLLDKIGAIPIVVALLSGVLIKHFGGLNGAIQALTKGIGALFTSTNAWVAGVMVVIGLLGALYNWIKKIQHENSFEGQVEKLSDLKQELNENNSELEKLYDKLDEYHKLIQQVNDGDYSVVNEEDLPKLQAETEEIETQIKYLEYKQQLLNKEQADTFTKAYDKLVGSNGHGYYRSDSYHYNSSGDKVAESTVHKGGFEYAYYQNAQELYRLMEQLQQTKDKMLDLEGEELAVAEKSVENLTNEINGVLQLIDSDFVKQLETLLADAGEGAEGTEAYANALGFLNQMKELVVGTNKILTGTEYDVASATNDSDSEVKKETKDLTKFAKALRESADKAKTLRGVLRDLNKESLEELFSSGDIEDIVKVFPNLIDEFDDYANGLINVNELAGEIEDTLLHFDAGNIVDAFNDAKDAIKDFGEGSWEAKEAIENIQNASPDVANALNVLGIKFSEADLKATSSAEAFWDNVVAMANVQLQEAKANYTKIQSELSNARKAAREATSEYAQLAATLVYWQKIAEFREASDAYSSAVSAMNTISKLSPSIKSTSISKSKTGGSKGSKSRGKSSSSSNTSIISNEYSNQVDLTEYYIKMSEIRQKRMEKDSEEYRVESAKQYAYNKKLVQSTYNELQRLRKKGYDESNKEYRDLAQKYEEYLNDLKDSAESIWDSINEEQQAAIQAEIDALEAQRDELDKQKDALKEEKDAIDDIIDGWEKEKDAIDDQIDEIEKLEDAEKERWESREKQLDFEIARNEAIIGLEEKYYDTLTSVREEQANLDKQLKSSLESYKYLDDEMRELLFNESDYDDLTQQLTDIASEATQLYEDYLEQLNNVTEETSYELEYITDAFERQYELKMKEYEIAKNELAVAKARKELENTQNERNVRMLVNGEWTWVADPNKVKSALEAVTDAEQAVNQSEADLTQTLRVQELQAANSELTLTKNQEQATYDNIIAAFEAQIEEYEAQKDIIDAEIEALKAQQDRIDAEIELIDERIEALKEQEEALDAQIDALKEAMFNFVEYAQTLEKGTDAISKAIDAIYGKELSSAIMGSFADGGVADFDGLAMLHGKSGGEMVLNNADVAKVYDLIHNASFLNGSAMGLGGNSSFAPMGNVTYGNSTNVYIDGVQLSAADSESIVEIFKRVIPMAR